MWGIAEWIEFDANGQRMSGNIPANETVIKVMLDIANWNEEEYYKKNDEEKQHSRVHDIGSGFFIPAKITSDGWAVSYDIGAVPVPCLNQPVFVSGSLEVIGFLLGFKINLLILILILIGIIVWRSKSLKRKSRG